ncbi:MAG: flavin reductase [Chloroflexi bacterium]|nr:flavin reductase [Chloroflexota bacterium]
MPGEYRAHLHVGPGGPSPRGTFEILDGGRIPSADSMRALRRLHAGAVTVVATVTAEGFRGITVSAFCIVSLAPPVVLICLGRPGEALNAVRAAGQFSVSILSDHQEFLAERFAGRAPLVNPRFEGVRHRVLRSGNPVLEECLAWFDCRVRSSEDVGDHAVVLGDVVEAGRGTGAFPLLYFDGNYRELQIE